MSNTPRTYTVRAGDDFQRIARVIYGTTIYAGNIRKANPGVTEPLQVGAEIVIPVIPDLPTDSPQSAPSNDINEVAIIIDGERFRFWESVTITRAMDAPDTVTFTAPFEPSDQAFRNRFRPFEYRPVDVTVGGEQLFTGVMLGVDPSISESRREVSVSAYSLPGVLQDCTPPASAFPIEYEGMTLLDICRAVAAPFGLAVEFFGSPGGPFERAAMNPGATVLSFLAPLAKERNFVIGSSPEGALRVWRSVRPGSPVARLREGEAPLLSVTPSFSPQDYFSHITGLEATDFGDDSTQYTVKNARIRPSVLRPTTFDIKDSEPADVPEAVSAKMGRMFANAASYSVSVATWRTPTGRLWEPNTTLTLFAPGAMVYREYEFIIRSVTFAREADSEIATLSLMMPGAFDGSLPESLPWDG